MARRQTKTFLHVLRHSLVPYDNYYGIVLHKTKFSFSLKYFFTLSALLVLFEMVALFTGVSHAYPFFTSQSGLSAIIEQIPEDLVLTLQQGKLLTNSDRPVIVFNPDIAAAGTLLVIDTKADKNKVYEYNARYLLTESELITNMDGQRMSFEYRNKHFLKNSLSISIGEIARHSSKIIWTVFFLLMIMLPLLVSAARFILLCLISVIVYVLSMRIIHGLNMSKVLQISFHAATAPLIIQTLTSMAGLPVPLSFWWFNIMITIFLFASLYEAYVLSSKPQD